MTPRHAMVLAAGLGTRMRPLTDRTAKPLLPLGGCSLLDHALDRLHLASVTQVTVNAHWQAGRVAEHLAARATPPDCILLHEPTLLDTGGAVDAALRRGMLGDAKEDMPFFVINGDAFWLDGPTPTLLRLAQAFVPRTTDALLLVHRACQVQADVGLGDFALDPWGVPRRRRQGEVVPFIYAGIQLASPALLADAPDAPFSMNLLWDRAMARGRLRALVHDGLWFHLSTPADLADAELRLQAGETGETR